MNIKPIGNRILIEVEMKAKMEKSVGGIFVPVKQDDGGKTQKAYVVEIGDDPSINVKIGDYIIYDKYAGTAFSEDDKNYLILRIDDIVAVIK